ncbi:WRKY DNA-binding transcription factor 70-like isoform X2 [Trifolium pratense]|nr:WRKY DNA-binding transcription factor 70-like isoform X2 [Trifolium pratense]
MEQELIRGRDTANQLLEVIENKLNINLHHHGDLEGLIIPLAQDLVNKVLRSFTNTLFLLNTNNDVFSDEEVLPITIKDLSKCPKLEETDHEACKSFKVQRGCYKRKSDAITWEKDSSILIEDGYEWRKYGQKKIMKAKYLRCISSTSIFYFILFLSMILSPTKHRYTRTPDMTLTCQH